MFIDQKFRSVTNFQTVTPYIPVKTVGVWLVLNETLGPRVNILRDHVTCGDMWRYEFRDFLIFWGFFGVEMVFHKSRD